MKRVLLLVCLIVSLVELDWERDRVYLLSSIASLSLVLFTERMRRQKVQKQITAKAFQAADILSLKALTSGSPNLDDRADDIHKGSSRVAIQATLSTMTSMAPTATSAQAKYDSAVEELSLFGSNSGTSG